MHSENLAKMTNTRKRSVAKLVLSGAEHAQLIEWTRRSKTAQALALRARIVLACARQASNGGVAQTLGVAPQTVAKWRSRFLTHRLEGLVDQPRPGTPRRISDAGVERVIAVTLHEPPRQGTHWTSRSLAARLGLSQSSVSRIWRAFGLQPRGAETFKLSADPVFIERVRDLVGLYLNPPLRVMALCVEQNLRHERRTFPQTELPELSGTADRRSYAHARYGTTTLLAALDAAISSNMGELHRRHRAREFLRFLAAVHRQVSERFEVHLIINNTGSNTAAAVSRWFERHLRFHAHETPTPASWVKQTERWFALLAQIQLRRGMERSTTAMEQVMRSHLALNGQQLASFVWIKNAA